MSGFEAPLIVSGVGASGYAAKRAYKHAVQHQELAVIIANQTGAELRYVDHYMQYGRTELSPDDPNIKPSSDNGWTFSKGEIGKQYGLNGLMRFMLGEETVIIAWNVPDPWGALFPWMKKDHRNNFDVKVVATQDVEGMTTKQIAKEHDLGSGIKLWRRSDDKWVLRNLDEDVHFECGAGRKATVRMTKSWKAGVLSVVLR